LAPVWAERFASGVHCVSAADPCTCLSCPPRFLSLLSLSAASASPSSYPQMDLSGLRVSTDGKGDFSLAAFDASLQAAAAKHGVSVVLTGNPELAGSKISVAAAQGAAKAAAEGLSGAQAAQAAAAAAASAQKEVAAATPVAAAAATPVAAAAATPVAAAAASALPSPGGVGKSAENTLGPPVQVVKVLEIAPPSSDQAKPWAGAGAADAAAGSGAGTGATSASDASAGAASAVVAPLSSAADASAAREMVDRLPNGAVRIRRTVTTRKVDVVSGRSDVSVKVTRTSTSSSSSGTSSQVSTAGAGAGGAANQSGGGAATVSKQGANAGASAGSAAAGAGGGSGSAPGAQAADAGRSLLRSNKE